MTEQEKEVKDCPFCGQIPVVDKDAPEYCRHPIISSCILNGKLFYLNSWNIRTPPAEKVVWPEKKDQVYARQMKFDSFEFSAGWNACHDAFTAIIKARGI